MNVESVSLPAEVVVAQPLRSMVVMGCADEGFQEREFALMDTAADAADYVCECGWMQSSPRAGGMELLRCATWHSDTAKSAFALLVSQQPDCLPAAAGRVE